MREHSITVAIFDGEVRTKTLLDRSKPEGIQRLAAALRQAADELEKCRPGCSRSKFCGLASDCTETDALVQPERNTHN